MPDAPAPSARFFVTNDNRLCDRILGCVSPIRAFNCDPPEQVSLTDMLGWLNKVEETRQVDLAKVAELQARLDANAVEGAAEQMRRQWEDANNQLKQTREQLERTGQERDEAKKAYHAAATEIATLASATRELHRLRQVHAAFVAGARSLLGERANQLEAEVDVPETFPEDAAEIAAAARLSEPRASASGSAIPTGETPAMEAAAQMQADADAQDPPVENQPVDLVLADRRKTLLAVLKSLKTNIDRFSKLQASLRMEPKAVNLPRRAVFAGASGAVYGMAMMAVRAVADEIHTLLPEDPAEKAAQDALEASKGWLHAMAALPGIWKRK